ncbi:hypothetical protein N7522_000253 [Penicillium canescens]|nr:hypothetical protein N7522_000253 [Penicillium canescens]
MSIESDRVPKYIFDRPSSGSIGSSILDFLFLVLFRPIAQGIGQYSSPGTPLELPQIERPANFVVFLVVVALCASTTRSCEDHPSTLTNIANLASTYTNQGRWQEAEQLEVPAIETRNMKLGENHPDTLISTANLASTWESLAHDAAAINLLRDCLTKRKQRIDLKIRLLYLVLKHCWNGERRGQISMPR